MKLVWKFYQLLTILNFLSQVLTQDQEIDYGKLALNTKLLQGSRWAIEQRAAKKVIAVYNAVEVVDISKVNVDTMSVRIEIHFRQRWDQSGDSWEPPPGLFSDDDSDDTYIQADMAILDSLWSPDSYFPAARETKIASVSTNQAVVNIFKNGTIINKFRLYTVLGCMFDFRWYPLDSQECYLQIESYTLPDSTVRYMWEDIQEPVIFSNLKLLQYDLRLPMRYENGSAPRWGRAEKFPYVSLEFAFERQIGYNLIQVFIPTTLVVILSWFSFWLGLDAVPGRISLLITCMLTLVTMHSGLKGSVPPVNYIKMMDIWMVGCMAFVFLALCEFVIVKYIHWRNQQNKKAEEDKLKALEAYHLKMKEVEGHNKTLYTSNSPYLDFYRNVRAGDIIRPRGNALLEIGLPSVPEPWNIPHHPNLDPPPKRPVWVVIDRISRFLFPFLFAAFNAAYWPWLVIGAANQ